MRGEPATSASRAPSSMATRLITTSFRAIAAWCGGSPQRSASNLSRTAGWRFAMLKKPIVLVSILAAVLALAVTYIGARFVDQKAIGRAQLEMQHLRAEHDSLTRHVATIETKQQVAQ